MPNFAYTNTTQFRPFSFEEQLRPLLMYTQAHQAVEDAYSELDSQANAVGTLADETNDPVTYRRYKAYEAALRSQADALAKNGLTPGSRKSLLDLKGRYAKEITPIQNAITRRRELADEQRKALLQNPTLMFQRDMNSLSYDSSLDRFLENPDYDYGEQYSGALITKQVSDMASHLAKEFRGIASGRLDDYTKTFMKKYGLSSGEVLSAIMNPNDPRGSRALSAIYDSAVNAVPEAIRNQYADEVRRYATQGFWSAIGQNQISPYEDYGARLEEQARMARVKKALENKATDINVPDITALYFPKDRKKIPELLDDKGKLKSSTASYGNASTYNLLDDIFKDGKFTKPKFRAYSSESAEAISYYNTINDILLNAGFSQETIDTMNKETIEKNLKAIKDENLNDAIGRNIYRYSLNAEATKFLFNKMKERGLTVREIKSMRNMVPQLGGDENPEYTEGTTASILYDPKGNFTGMMYNGAYYDIARDLMSKNFYDLMDTYASSETQEKIQDAKEVQQALLYKISLGHPLTPQEYMVLEQVNGTLDYWGGVFDNIGNNMVNYVGTRNINKAD